MSFGKNWSNHLYRILYTTNYSFSFQSQRNLTRVLQPLVDSEDLNEISLNDLSHYERLIQRYGDLSAKAIAGGGPRGIERHVVKNKKVLVRDRIKMLIDPGTNFLEIGHFAGFDMLYGDVPCAGTVGGIGRVAGIYCMIGGNDATVKGGTYFPITVKKSHRSQDMAELNKLPCIYMPDSGGAFLPMQAEIFIPGGRSFYNQAVMSSKGIAQIALVCGSCTAGGAYNPTMSDEAIVVDQIAKIYLGGPPLVRAATGEIVSEEDLGGAFMHSSVSGCTDYFARTEVEAFEMCRDVVESLNMNTIVEPSFKEPLHSVTSWTCFGAKNHLSKPDLYTLLSAILDGSQFKEFKAYFGPGLITGVGSIEGMRVGVVTNSDDILSPEALKATHFMDMCSRRDIPILFLQNSQTRDPSTNYDQAVLKDRAKLSSMVANLHTPKIVVTLSACYDDDFLIMCGQSFSPNIHLMWPSAKLSTLEMNETDVRSDAIDSFTAAANMLTDAIILPEHTRKVVGEILRIVSQQKYNQSQAQPRPIFRM